jgi:HSP20 family protein
MTFLMKPEPFTREIDRLFDTLFEVGEWRSHRWLPPMDLAEQDDHFVLTADLPGLDEGDVNIEIQDNTLTISGERKSEHEERRRGWFRAERSFGSFSRSLSLPEGVDANAITAEFDRGVLEIRIPKPEERKPHRIAISARGNGKPAAVEGTAEEK